MKNYFIVLIALMSFAVGYGARYRTVRELREDRDDARRALDAIGPGMLVQSPAMVERETVMVAVEDVSAGSPVDSEPAEMAGDERPERPQRSDRSRRARDQSWNDPEAREERMREFAERMRGRAEESLKSFVEEAGLSEDQARQLDKVIYDMNEQASGIVSAWSEYIREAGEWNSDYTIRFAHDISGALVDAYDSLDENLGSEWRDKAGGFSLMRMMDPEVFSPLRDLQREMGGGMMMGGFMNMGGGGRGGSRGGRQQGRGAGERRAREGGEQGGDR